MRNDVLFYLTGVDGKRQLFEKEVISLVPGNRRVVCESLREFVSIIRKSVVGRWICVVLAGNKRDLIDLFQIRDVLKESRLILVLPDQSDDMVALGHMFYPRYAESGENGFGHIAAVLLKMAGIDSGDSGVASHNLQYCAPRPVER